MSLRPLSDVSAADWFAGQDVHRLGPAGFAEHARLLHPWLEGPGEGPVERADGYLPDDELALLCAVLGQHTTTPEDCFFALWEGYGDIYGGDSTAFLTAFAHSPAWPSRLFRPPKPVAPPPPAFSPAVIDGPRLSTPHREFLLFGGALAEAGQWGATGYGHGIPRHLNSPNLMWPADHAWFVTTDIEGAWTGLAGSTQFVASLLRAQGLEVVRARYDDPEARG